MITQDTNISLAILTADCCPIFIFDIDSKFIACLHAGWRGVYKNIVKNASISPIPTIPESEAVCTNKLCACGGIPAIKN